MCITQNLLTAQIERSIAMRNLKKILALVLAMVMTLSIAVTANAA